jgi:hypothetical protein
LPPQVRPDAQYWATLARALHETGMGRRDPEAIRVLRQGLQWLPTELELVLQAGSMLEQTDPKAAVALYAAFPPPADGAKPDFDHACVANSCVRLIIEQRDFEHPHLIPALVIVGRVLGVLNIEKHVQALDLANQTDTIKEAYLRILPDTVDQTAFFRSKGWTTSSMGA